MFFAYGSSTLKADSAPLKSEAEAELNLPRKSRGRRRPAEVGRGNAHGCDTERSAGRHLDDRVIEGIDHFRPELHPQFLLDEGHGLRQGQVRRHKPWTMQIDE